MAQVSADQAALQQALDTIRAAVDNAAGTRAGLRSRYDALGQGWGDEKYRTLGEVVESCDVALRSSERELLALAKQLLQAMKALASYEETRLEGGGGPAAGPGEQAGYLSDAPVTCFGVPVAKGALPQGYDKVVAWRHMNARPEVQKVFDQFAEALAIQNAEYPAHEVAHYSPENYRGHPRGVYYNAGSDQNNPRGAATTYYHELAHMIDHAATGYQGCLSASPEFRDALLADGQDFLKYYNSMPPERQQAFLRRIQGGSAHSLSDLLDVTTGGQLHGGYGHTPEYWQTEGNLQAEAFAHFFEASMGSEEKLAMLSTVFPHSFPMFSTMMEDLAGDQPVLRLVGRR